MRSRITVALVAAALASSSISCRSTPPSGRDTGDAAAEPRLLVLVVIDQMRFDYLDRFKPFWKEGFARILKDAAIFENGAYPYLNTVTCVGHATIATGTLPAFHGIVLNELYDRTAGRRVSCTDDPNVKSVPYEGPPEKVGHSAYRLRVPTIGDRLREASPESRVVTLSMKPRSAVMLAGHGGTPTWFSVANVWSTSTAFTPMPLPEVQAYVSAHPVDELRGETWNRVYDPQRYSGEDDGVGEQPPLGWTPHFSHPLVGKAGTPQPQFYELWERSPYSDVALGELAASLVASMKLGQRGVVDLLGVSFSAVDYVGHNFGPDSHELQDTMIRLDHTLGQFLDMLDRTVGNDRYALGLSADHGVSFIPEALKARGMDAGRVVAADVKAVAEAAMVKALGKGPHVAWVEYTDLYLSEPTRARVSAEPELLRPLIDAVGKMPGVLRVLPSAGLDTKRESSDPIERAAALSYYPGQSGDAIVVVKPNWINTTTAAATHGSFHPYDRQVPVLFLGARFKAGRFGDPATPADIAPTLASLVQLPLPDATGRVLKTALK